MENSEKLTPKEYAKKLAFFYVNKHIALISILEAKKILLAQYNKLYTKEYQLEIGYWCNSDECLYWSEVEKELVNLYKKLGTQRLCAFCNAILIKEDVDSPNLYLACLSHKKLAEENMEKYFKKNPEFKYIQNYYK